MSESIVPLKISSVDKLTNHWIAEGERIATERIIKLLEEHTINAKHGVTPQGNSHFWEMGMKYAIAVIKGEK